MALSKARNKERMRQIRLHTKEVQPKLAIPLYNPSIHRAGDRVMVYKGRQLIKTVIPELDGDGNAILGY